MQDLQTNKWEDMLKSSPNIENYPQVVHHTRAVAHQVENLCRSLGVHPYITSRAIALAWLHDYAKASWLEEEKKYGINKIQLNELNFIHLNLQEKIINDHELQSVVRLLPYLNIDILNSCQLISLPLEPRLVYWSDLHCINETGVYLDERKKYLHERYFKNREEEFIRFWAPRENFASSMEEYLSERENNTKIYSGNIFDLSEGLPLSRDIGGWMYAGEDVYLMQIAIEASKLSAPMCEVGSWRGRSSVILASSLHKQKLYCIDNWKGGSDDDCIRLASKFDIFAEFLDNTRLFSNRIETVRGLSNQVGDLVPNAFSLLFLDGDHSKEPLAWEVEHLGSRVIPQGILAFHDTDNPRYPAVREIIEQLISSDEWTFIGQVGYMAALRRK